MRTKFTDMFGLIYPIMQGGMQNVGLAQLAAAVSEAGGLGTLTALTQPDPDALAREIRLARSITDAPLAVNLTCFPSMRQPPYEEYIEAAVSEGITIFETAGIEARNYWPTMKSNGARIIHKCTSVRHAESAEKAGADAISIDGFECAGHPGEDDVPGLILIPIASARLTIPIIASGGFADGRGLVAAMALGAEGINMGTRFCATREAPIHDRVKRAYIENDERGTNLIFRSFRNTARVGKSEVSDEVVRRLANPDAVFADVAELVAGASGKRVIETGDLAAGVFWAGQTQGLISDIPTVQELIERIVEEATAIISLRLPTLLNNPN